jgi:DNA replication and repair protein RecF
MEVRDLRNIREATLELTPGLNVFCGSNAQGKTSLLEAVGLLARGRSFRTDQTDTLVRRGALGLSARGLARDGARRTELEVRVGSGRRELRVDGRDVAPRAYHGRLEVVVYSTERLRVVRGGMRERRLFLDRAASALWPAYRQCVRDYERVVCQRNAALRSGGRALAAWDERLARTGGDLRARRARYVERLRRSLVLSRRFPGEAYDVAVTPSPESADEGARLLGQEIEGRRAHEQRAGRTLVGPHRDHVGLTVDGEDAAVSASSGQARSFLLALTLAVFDVYQAEREDAPVALLDDLDSELDEERTASVCHEVARRGQALVTTAHAGWVRALGDAARTFTVTQGRVSHR